MLQKEEVHLATGINKKYVNSKNSITLNYNGKQSNDEIINKKRKFKFREVENYGDEPNNLLIHGDNLLGLEYLLNTLNLKGKIDLIYIDPPYGTNSIFKTRSDKIAYSDQLIEEEYIEFLRERIILMRELLSDKGSIYVHLDETMAFSIKIIMDEVFGRDNFRNWITRIKSSNKNTTRNRYGNIADYIMYYTKTKQYIWNRAYTDWNEETILKEYPNVEPKTNRRYKKVPIHAPGIRNGETAKEWRGLKPPPGKHWQYLPSKLDEFDAKGEIYWSKNGNPRRKVYLDNSKGIAVQDVWDLKDARHQSHKITGYPTEKNKLILDRIISSSSNEDSIVLDCFAGSGTTLVSAQEHKRKWIGMDSSSESITTIINRFEHGSSAMGDYVLNNKVEQQSFEFDNLNKNNSCFKLIEINK